MISLRCIGCGKEPNEIDEYINEGVVNDMTPGEFVRTEEGTYNSLNGHFACTDCYIKMGSPGGRFPRNWVAP